MKRAKTFFLLKISLAVIILFTVLFFNFRDRILVSIVRGITGVQISYSCWKGNPLGRSVVSAAELRVKNFGVVVRAEEILLGVDLSKLLSEKRFSLKCSLSQAVILLEEKDSEEIKNILDLISSSGQVFDTVDFVFVSGRDGFSVRSFSAVSSDISTKGNIFFDKSGNSVSVDFSISVSPRLISGTGENLKNRILSPQDDGWFGTTITYKGNPAFLRAFYLAVIPDPKR